MLDEINPETGNFRINDVMPDSEQQRAASGEYDNPKKYYQGVHVPTGETMADFWRWWRAQCAEMDSKPKHIARSDRWTGKKK